MITHADLAAAVYARPELEEIRHWLRTNSKRASVSPDDILLSLHETKRLAVGAADQLLASSVWCLENIVRAEDMYLTAYSSARQRDFYNSWCELERAEIPLFHLRRHFEDLRSEFGVRDLAARIERFQSLFPYKLFFSPGMRIIAARCSICQERIALRSSCGHNQGDLYDGVMCGRIIHDVEMTEISVVTNPVQKYSVGFVQGAGSHNYALVDYLVRYSDGPWAPWSYVIEKRTRKSRDVDHARYTGVGRNDRCPCGSGNKFKRCCESKLLETHDHYQFSFGRVRGNPPTHQPEVFVGTRDQLGLRQSSGSRADEVLDYIACDTSAGEAQIH